MKSYHRKHYCVQQAALIFAVVMGLLGTHPLFAQATGTPSADNEGRLSTKAQLYVRKFVFDGMSLARLKKRPENNPTQKCFDENKYREFSQSRDGDAKKALSRVYRENREALKYACRENIRKAHTHHTDCDDKKQSINKIIQTRIDNHRIAILDINRQMTAEEIQDTKNKITRCYIENKYINSGAMIPDQEIKNDGIIVIRIIEGWLAQVKVENENDLHLSSRYVNRRLKFTGDEQGHLNMNDLQGRMQIMQQNPLFKQVIGKIAPGDELGEGILKVTVKETKPLHLGFRFNNYRHPSVGAYRGALELSYRNPLGLGDALSANVGLTEGLNDYSLNYSVPFPQYLTNYDTTLSLGFNKSDSDVVTEPFNKLGVQSDSETLSVSLRQPLYKSYPPSDDRDNPNPYQEFAVALTLEKRKNTTFLEDKPFSFSRGALNGETEYAVIRLSPEYVRRTPHNVIAFYNTFSFGTDALSPTIDKNIIDNRFVTWLGQFQWFGRVSQLEKFNQTGQFNWLKQSWLGSHLWESRLLFRTNIQLADEQLFSLEKFPIGGHASVRGYRESQMIRDNGLTASLEWLMPIGHLPFGSLSEPGEGKIELIPFIDYGRGWNNDDSTPVPKDISSVGLGLRWLPTKNTHVQVYWAKALRNIDNPENQEHDLQDEGLHFEINFRPKL